MERWLFDLLEKSHAMAALKDESDLVRMLRALCHASYAPREY
jgi:hypothetical protein